MSLAGCVNEFREEAQNAEIYVRSHQCLAFKVMRKEEIRKKKMGIGENMSKDRLL